MDEVPRQDCSPAAPKNTKLRVRKRPASSSKGNNEPRPEPKRRCRKKVATGAKGGGQINDGDPSVTRSETSCSVTYKFPSTRSEPDTNAHPPQSPLFGITSPQESWMIASESPSPITPVRRPACPSSFDISRTSNFPSNPFDDHNNFSGTKTFLGRGHVSGRHVQGARDFTRSPEHLRSFGITCRIDEPGNSIMEHQKPNSASTAARSVLPNGVDSMNEMNGRSSMQDPINPEMYVNGFSPQISNTLSSTASYTSPYTPSQSDKKPNQSRDNFTGRSASVVDGFEPLVVIEWHPASLLSMDNEEPQSQYALLVLNQPIRNLNMLKLIWNKAFFHIAADGGANRLSDAFKDPCLKEDFEKIGLEVICGDLDSLSDRVREDAQRRGTKIIEDPDQNSTDFQKCVVYLRKHVLSERPSTSNILCLGGLGGRVDQALSQLHHLYMEQQDPHYKNGRVFLLSTECITFLLKRGTHRVRVRDPRNPVLGKHIGILPLKEPSVITTKGLEWDVTDWPTEFGGQISTSNHVQEDIVEITTTSDVLFTIDLNFPAGNHEHPELQHESMPIISMEDNMFYGTETNPHSY